MKKLNKLTHIFIFLTLFSGLMLSCGTEEDLSDETLEIGLSSMSVPVGTQITFNLSSNIAGDVSSEAVYFVNGQQIDGSSFTPTEVNDSNEVYATYNGKTSDTKIFASTDVIPSQYTQKVLLEDYTGTWCGYCPRMATIVHYLAEYSDRIVPVAIHTPGAPTDPWTYEFATVMASPSNYNAMGAPKGKINRTIPLNMFEGSQPCPNDPNAYYPQVDPYLNQSAPLGLAINSTLNGSSLNIQVKVGFATDSVPDARLVVYLVEDDLVYNQANYYSGTNVTCDGEFNYAAMPNPIPNFVQEHVLLKSYTDIFGDEIPSGQISNGSIYTRDFNVALPSNIGIGFGGTVRADKLHIVAFVLGNGDQVSNRAVVNVQSALIGINQDFD